MARVNLEMELVLKEQQESVGKEKKLKEFINMC